MKTNTNDKRRSKYLSWLLRHGALEMAITMDAAGWVAVDDVLALTGWSRSTLEHLVATNTKRRLQWEHERIRCCQGHSTAGVPVTQAALEASWSRHPVTDSIWHCTNLDALEFIEAQGCRPQRRTHVHCTSSLDSAVGKRSRTPIGLEISAQRLADHGLGIFVAPNGVVLVRRVPRDCIIGMVAMTKRGEQALARERARFGLD